MVNCSCSARSTGRELSVPFGLQNLCWGQNSTLEVTEMDWQWSVKETGRYKEKESAGGGVNKRQKTQNKGTRMQTRSPRHLIRRPKHGLYRRKQIIISILVLTRLNWDFLSRTTTQQRGKEGHCLLQNSSTQEEQDSRTTQWIAPLQGSLCRNRQALHWRNYHNLPTAWLQACDFLCAEKERLALNFNMRHLAWLQCEATTHPWLFSHIPWVRKGDCYGLAFRQETEKSSQMSKRFLWVHSGLRYTRVYWN